jgi:DNA polymerase-3 subunit gamma/tau
MFGEEELQLYYQIVLIGKRDLPLAPDPRTGFEMVMLRLLAFQPGDSARRPVDGGARRSAAAGSGRKSTVDAAPAGKPREAPESALDWRRLARELPLKGWAQELAMNLALRTRENGIWSFELNPQHEHLVNAERTDQVSRAISERTGETAEVKIRLSEPSNETPVQSVEREKSDRQSEAERAIRNDPDVKDLIEQFDATLVEDSVRPRR